MYGLYAMLCRNEKQFNTYSYQTCKMSVSNIILKYYILFKIKNNFDYYIWR